MKRTVGDSSRNLLMMVFPPLAATFLMWLARLNEVTLFEFLCAAGLLAAAWIPYYKWRTAKESYLPLLAVVSFMFWVFYVLALFWGSRRSNAARAELSDQSIEQAMLLALIGVACLWIGKWTRTGHRLVSRKVPNIRADRESTWSYIRTALLISIPLSIGAESRAYLFGGGGRQAITILTSTVPMVLFVLLFRKMLRRQANHGEVLLIVGFLATKFLAGIASGWLGAGVAIMATCAAAYLYEQRRVPKTAVVMVFAYILFFQPGKQAFRKTFWSERVDASLSQKVSYWSNESMRDWQVTLENPNADNWRRLTDQSLSRVSLLQQTAHVIDLTPGVVPFQHGRTYSYMLVTLIPRALWENKPTVNEANRFYQVAYGLTDADQLDTVSISVGALAESFINFGWWGPVLIMVPLGIFFDYFQHTFLGRDSGWLLNAVGIALIPSFLAVEAQLAQYTAGIVQCVGVALLVLWPVLHLNVREGKDTAQPAAELATGGLRMPLAMPRRFL